MKEPRKPHQKDLIELLDMLRETPPRDPSALDHGRAAFLEQVNSLPEPVSQGRIFRHKGYRNTGQLRLRTLTIAVAIFFAVLASGVITVSAAQDAVPGEQLYPVKIWYEDIRLVLTFSDTRKLELHLEFAAERLAEANELIGQGLSSIPDQISEDFHNHIQKASLLLHDNDDHGYGAQLEDLVSQYDELEGKGEVDDRDVDENENVDEDTETSDGEDQDQEDAAEKDDDDEKESEDKKETEDSGNSTDDTEENVGSTESDDDQHPEETDEFDNERNEHEETDEPDDND